MYGPGNESTREYRPPYYFTSEEDGLWNRDPVLRSGPVDNTAISMRRFLADTESLSFHPEPRNYYAMNHPYSTVEAHSPEYFVSGTMPYAYPAENRSSSPSASGPSSSYIGSSWSDRQTTPMSSPAPSMHNLSPEMANANIVPFPYGGQPIMRDDKPVLPGSCVALHDVQNYADAQTDRDIYDEDEQGAYYSSYVQEGYQPMQYNEEPPQSLEPSVPAVANGIRHPESPNIRRRRPQPSRSATAPKGSAKVSKRPNGKKRSASYHSKSPKGHYNGHSESNSNRAFPCPLGIYGCPSTFGSKNEWKRHVNTQHIRLGYWRCDQCDQVDKKPNDFNRKDLFIQHIRRMHPYEKTKTTKTKPSSPRSGRNSDPEELALAAAATRCFREIRQSPDETGCYFCDMKFNGAGTWDERLEHIGRHLEHAKKDSDEMADPHSWQKDQAMEDWLAEQEIIVEAEDGWTLA